VAAAPQFGRATGVERPAEPGAAAAGQLYERYSAQIYSYCLHQLNSREEAEDAVQTTFMNAFRGLQRGIVPELESAWLFKIAHNVCLARRRSSWRRGRVEAPNNFEVLQEIVPGRDQVSDELIRLPDVLEEMPENQRRAILLREWQGLTYREISTELGLSQAAVETLIFRARRALAQGLEQDADTTWKRRLRRGADVGGVLACVKALLGGGGAAAVKVAATAIAVATTAVAAATHTTGHAHHVAAAKMTPAPQLVRKSGTSKASAATPLLRRSGSWMSAHKLRATRSLPKATAFVSSAPALTESAPETPAASATTPPPPASTPSPTPATQAAAQPAASSATPTPAPKEDRAVEATTQPTETTPASEEPASTGSPSYEKPDKPAKPEKPTVSEAPAASTTFAGPSTAAAPTSTETYVKPEKPAKPDTSALKSGITK
jgi:RNA polymerase sigma factor (sigma-70 family)